MSALNLKSKHKLCQKILMPVIFLTSMSFVPSVNATNELGEWYTTILTKFKLRPQQLDNLLLAKQYSNKSGRPDIIQAFMLQESGASVAVKSNGNCHGILQIMTSTAMSFVKSDPDLRAKYFDNSRITPKAVEQKLKTDVPFSIEVADSILASNLEKTASQERVIYGYNRGDKYMLTVKNPGSLKYVKEVTHKVVTITQQINKLSDPEV